MRLYLLTVLIYFILFNIEFRNLKKKNRLSLMNINFEQKSIRYGTLCCVSFTPIFRLVALLVYFYICLASDKTIEQLKESKSSINKK